MPTPRFNVPLPSGLEHTREWVVLGKERQAPAPSGRSVAVNTETLRVAGDAPNSAWRQLSSIIKNIFIPFTSL